MTDEVTTYALRRSAARQSADTQGRLSFTRGPAPVAPTGVPSQGGVPTSVVSDPAPVAPRDVVSEGRVPDSVVSDPLPTPAPISNPSQAANGRQAGTGEQGRVPIQQPSFSPRAAPRSDPSQAANDGSQAARREQGRVPSVVQEGRVPVDPDCCSCRKWSSARTVNGKSLLPRTPVWPSLPARVEDGAGLRSSAFWVTPQSSRDYLGALRKGLDTSALSGSSLPAPG